jgi:hypothetical protein
VLGAGTVDVGPATGGARHAAKVGGQPYERHRPEETILFKVLRAHWKTFVLDLEAAGPDGALPAFVVSEIEAFLKCGILAHGLVLVKCADCGWSRAVGFSCQRRGFCPSCIGRRMCDFAARLRDRVMPSVPIRQWVLTVPYELRAKLAFDPSLTTLVLRELMAAVSSWLRRRARGLGLRGTLKTGAVTVVQRFNPPSISALIFTPSFSMASTAFLAAGSPCSIRHRALGTKTWRGLWPPSSVGSNAS